MMLADRFRQLSLTNQMILPITLAGFLVLSILGFLSAQESFKDAKENAIEKSSEMGQRYATRIKTYFEKPFAQTDFLSRSLLTQITNNTQNRQRTYNDIHDLLESDNNYLATWSAWEPDAFDGRDKEFANQPQHEHTGRVYPWWIRQEGKLIYKTILNPETPDLGDWYFKPMAAKKSMLLEPYSDTINGKWVVMTSAVSVIVKDGKALGIVGIDLDLQSIKEVVNAIKPYSQSQAYLISDAGNFVTHPEDAKLNKPVDFAQKLKDALGKGELDHQEFTEAGQEFTYQVIPIPIYGFDQKWSLVIKTPMSEVLADAQETLWHQAIYSFLGLILLMGTVYFSARVSAKKVSHLSHDLSETSSVVGSSIGQLNVAGGSLAQSSAMAAASIEETVAAIEELTTRVRMNTDNAQVAADLSKNSTDVTSQGVQHIEHLQSAMADIAASSKKIEEIITIIEEIAFQTNLLALNASVEAARAGEHGKSFAVVAEAVRSLAQRSAGAAKDITQLIRTSVEQIRNGNTVAEQSGDVLKKVSSSIEKVSSLNGEIAQASKEQAAGILLIQESINKLDSVIQTNAAQAEEIVATASDIERQSSVIQHTVKALSGQAAA